MPRSRGALVGGGAKESYPANTTPGGTGEEVTGHPSPAVPLPQAVDSKTGGEMEGAKRSPGRRSIVRGPELLRLLKERRKDPICPRSGLHGKTSSWCGGYCGRWWGGWT